MKPIKKLVRTISAWAWQKNDSDKILLDYLDKNCIGIKVCNDSGMYIGYYPNENKDMRGQIISSMKDQKTFLETIESR